MLSLVRSGQKCYVGIMRSLILALILATAAAMPAHAWWQYAEWGFTPSQIASASSGQAVPCRADAPVCTPPPGGLQPSLFVERLTMVGMPASASFAFDGSGKLAQTVVLFPDSEPALLVGLLQGVHGKPTDEVQRVWRDERRGTIITAVPAGRGTMLVYRPTER
ncbi:MAG: hypothetical protein HYX38_25380 [Rhodospirillales bacterium]|nr:hypothetical protein [Rhodospirillales bacterium]